MNHWFHKFVVAGLVIVPLFSVLAAIILLWNEYVFYSDLVLLLIFYCLTGLGITVGYHRMLTHQGFQTSAWVRGLFLIFGAMAFEGSPLQWAATHVQHHAHSDDEGDPHSPLDGFWHAHLGWLFSPQCTDPERYVPHLRRDPLVAVLSRLTPVWMLLSLLLPYIFGGWTGLVWAGGVRIFLLTHVTWSVNSVCHTFGKRDFETVDQSRNHWLVGLLAFGEGWHNNHHAFPTSAFHGLRWWQFDGSGLLIRILETFGLVWNVQRVAVHTQQSRKMLQQSMRHKMTELRQQLEESVKQARTEIEKMSEWALAVQEAAFHDLCSAAMSRLNEIQSTVKARALFRKNRILAYQKEVQSMLAQLQSSWKPKLS